MFLLFKRLEEPPHYLVSQWKKRKNWTPDFLNTELISAGEKKALKMKWGIKVLETNSSYICVKQKVRQSSLTRHHSFTRQGNRNISNKKSAIFPPLLIKLFCFCSWHSVHCACWILRGRIIRGSSRSSHWFFSVFGSNSLSDRNVPAGDDFVKIHVNSFPVLTQRIV